MRSITTTIIFAILLNCINGSACHAGPSHEDAVELFNQKKFAQAATAFEQIVKIETKNANAYYYLALCYLQSHRSNAARSMFSETITRFPGTQAAEMAKKALQGLGPQNLSASGKTTSGITAISNSAIFAGTNTDNLPRQFMVPYTMRGPKYMVNAAVNGHPLEMFVDTGCDRIIIPVEYVDDIGMERPSTKYIGRYPGTGAGVWREYVNIQLGPLIRNKIPIDIIDSSSWPGVPLIGNIFFTGYSRSFNTADSTLRAIRETSQSDNALSASGECLLSFERDRYRQSPLIDAVINGRKMKVMFDTGGNDAIWITYEEAAALGVDPENGTTQYVGSTRIPCVALTVEKVQLGKVILQDVKTMIFNKSQATWGSDIVCFGSATLNNYGYNFVVDDKAKVIRIRKQ